METSRLKEIIKENEGKVPLYTLCQLLKRTETISMSVFIMQGLLERFTLEHLGKQSNCRNYIESDRDNKAWHEFLKKELEYITNNLTENSDVLDDIPAPYQLNDLIEIEHKGQIMQISAIRENGDLVTDFAENKRSIFNVLHLDAKQLSILNEGISLDGDVELPQEVQDAITEAYDPDTDGSYEADDLNIKILNSFGYTASGYVSSGIFDIAKLDSHFKD